MVKIIADVYTSKDGEWMIVTFADVRKEDNRIVEGGKTFRRTTVLAPLKPVVGDEWIVNEDD